jgi:hypothetical protein
MKALYEDVKLEVIRFEAEDVITASGDWGEEG